MKIEMAESEYFSIGSIVCCTTCYNQKIQGEVMAFDHPTKMLAIKCAAVSGKHNVHDVRLVNLAFVSDVKVIKEAEEPAPQLSHLNIQKINSRLRQNLEEKRRQVNYIGVGVSPEGQRVFNAIVKTINDCKWDKQDIVVMEEVVIRPPYGLEDCVGRGKDGSRALDHVRKIVQKHLADTENQRNIELRKSMSPSPASSGSS